MKIESIRKNSNAEEEASGKPYMQKINTVR
jgi:hypothetical protein